MNSAFREKLASYGQWTYRGAWALEISAAALGLITGVALGYQAFSTVQSSSVTSMDLALASAPFLMVAIAELTKIPAATLLFTARWRWKPVVFLFLLALAGITFETVFMGLERAATLRQLQYEEVVNEIKRTEAETASLSRRIADLSATDQVKLAQEELNRISEQAGRARNDRRGQLDEVERQFEALRSSPQAIQLRSQLDSKTAERDRLVEQRDRTLERDVGAFERQRESFVERIRIATASGDLRGAREAQERLDRLVNPRPAIELQFNPRIASLDADVLSARAAFEKAQSEALANSTAERRQLEARRDDIQRQLDLETADWTKRQADARQQLTVAQTNEAGKRAQIQDAEQARSKDTARLADLEKQRIEFARTDQIRRIAARFYGVRPEGVTDDQAGLIGVIWFGSLAALAALAGPITAIVALSLQWFAAGPSEPERTSKLSRLLWSLLVTWRWRRVRTVNVPVEVPVDREVEKRVEVPVEKVVKEILYVPVLTDDPEAVRKAMNEGLPKDVAELVSVSMAGGRDGSKAQHQTA